MVIIDVTKTIIEIIFSYLSHSINLINSWYPFDSSSPLKVSLKCLPEILISSFEI
jgi:hypothetical protein